MARLFLKKMARLHCARGPKRCEICKQYAKEKKWALLEVSPEENPQAARPVIEIEIDGEKVFETYDIKTYFDTREEAVEYIEKNNLTVRIEEKE